MNKMFKSRLISKESKILYYTYFRPIAILYGCETWSTIKDDEGKLLSFEKKKFWEKSMDLYETQRMDNMSGGKTQSLKPYLTNQTSKIS